MTEAPKKNVLVFRKWLLAPPQGFVAAQFGAYRRYRPQYIGLEPTSPSLPLPADTIYLSRTLTPLGQLRKKFYSWTGSSRRFHREARSAQAHLIHAQFADDGPPAAFLAKALRVPLVVTLYGSNETMPDESVKSRPEGRSYLYHRELMWETTSLFLCISDFIKQRAIQTGFPAHKLRVHYTGLDLETFTPLEVPRNRDLVLFVGRMAPKKGFDHLLRAMKIVRSSRPEASLLAIGDGPLRRSHEGLARELGIPCVFAGEQSREFIREHLARARVFCAPSTTARNGDSEGLGFVFAEALAMGLPVVSYRHGGIPEIVKHGENGLLANEGDIQQLAENVVRYLDDDGLWQTINANSRKWVSENFNIKRKTEDLENIYDEVLSLHGRA